MKNKWVCYLLLGSLLAPHLGVIAYAAAPQPTVDEAVYVNLDEYGVMSGLVTLEDIVEEIVGEIDDEYDEIEDSSIVELEDGKYLIDGSLNIDEVNETCGTEFSSEDFESIGGLVLGQCNGSPILNQELEIDNVLLTIKEIDKNRIVSLQLELLKEIEDEENEVEEKHD